MKNPSLKFGLMLFALGFIAMCLTGCHALEGVGYSAATEREYQAGKLTKKTTKRDFNVMTSRDALTSKDASGFRHTRTNLTGTTSETVIGRIKSDPDEKAIESTGTAGGKLLNGAVNPGL